MVGREEQGVPAGDSAGTSSGIPGEVRDSVMESFQRIGILKGRAIIDAQPQEVNDQFADLLKKQTTNRKKISNLISQTKQELKNGDSNRKSKIHETYVKSLIAARLEAACQHKMKLDNIHFDIVSIIDEVDAGLEESPQWVAVQEYTAQFQKKWEEYNTEIAEFTEYLAQMDEKFVEEQEEETGDGRVTSQVRQPKWRPKLGMDPGPIMEDITKGEWRIYLEKFDSYAIASTEDGEPSELFMRNAISSKLDNFWYERVTQAANKRMKDCTFQEITEEISRTLSVRYPETTAQADLFRISKAEGKTASRLYAYVNQVAMDANLESLNQEKIKIIITINALDERDKRLKEKTLEATGQGKEELTDTLFKRLIQEHEHWLANQKEGKSKAKVQKVQAKGSKKIICYCCGMEGHYKDKCYKKNKAFCTQCKEKGHFKEACREGSNSVKRARSSSRDRKDRGRSRSRDRGEKKKSRPPTPANYKSRTRKASHPRVSDSEPDEQRSRSRSRGERESGKMVRCRDKQGEGKSNKKMFRGYNSKDNSTLRKLEH